MQNSSQDEKACEEALKCGALQSPVGSEEQVPGCNINDGETTPKKSRPNVEADFTKNYRVKHSDPTDDDDEDDVDNDDSDNDDDDDSAEDDAPIDCLPDSDDDDDDAYEFLGDGDYLTIGAAAKATESSPFLELDMGGYTLHPRYRSLTVSQKDQSEDPVNEHIVAAEALFREGFQVTLSI